LVAGQDSAEQWCGNMGPVSQREQATHVLRQAGAAKGEAGVQISRRDV
jgi:hypothetical protein